MLKLKGGIDKVYVLSPGSLRENWISEYCSVCGVPSISLEKFVFITYNYEVKDQVMKLEFDNSLVIIDEVHNLVMGAKNFSSNSYAIYHKIVNTDRCRVLALSGTPVFNSTIDFAILGNMLSKKFNWILKNGSLKQAEERESSWDTVGWNERMQNPVLIRQLISGIVSFYGGDLSEYPDVRHIEAYRCPMSLEQYEEYSKVYKSEDMRRKNPPSIKIKFYNPQKYKEDFIKYIIAVQWTSTRAASNCLKTKAYNFIPDMFSNRYVTYTTEKFKEILSKLPLINEEPVSVDKIIENLKEKNGILFGDIQVPFKYEYNYYTKKIKVFGWMTDDTIKEPRTSLFNMSQKYRTLLTNIILNPNQKHIIFSFYKSTRGTLMLYSFLSHCGIKAELYSGDLLAMTRKRLVDKFNHPSNSDGQKIQVMLLTEAGGEGISLLGVNHVHIVESSINENKNIQAIGRAVRYKSHSNLPEERNFVNVYRYWSVWNGGLGESPDVEDVQIDQLLYEKHFSEEVGKKKVINEFQTLMENYSIEEIGPGDEGGEMDSEQGWEEQNLEEQTIDIVLNINGVDHNEHIPSSFSIEDTTNFLIAKYLLPPLIIRNKVLENVMIDLNIVSKNNLPFEVSKNNLPFETDFKSVDVNSQDKMENYIEDLILYTYNIEGDVKITKLKFVGLGISFNENVPRGIPLGTFSLKDISSDITTIEKAIELLRLELESFYEERFPNISIDRIELFDSKNYKNRLTDKTNLLIYFLNKIPINYTITISNKT